MNMLTGGPLATVRFISSGCGVRLFLFALRLSRTFGGSYENSSTPLLCNISYVIRSSGIELFMKKNLLFFFLVVACISCTKNAAPLDSPSDNDPVISPDSVLVSLNANIGIEKVPLTKSGSSDDLYAVRIYQYFTGQIGEARIAAYGTFDDLSKAIVKMSKKHLYGIDIAYIPNAKNLVYHSGDSWGVPFNAVWNENGGLNEMMYPGLSAEPVWGLGEGAIQEKDITDYRVQSNNWSTIQRYQGVAFCNPAVSSSVNITLYTMMVGFRLEISDFTSGTVSIGGMHGHKYSAKPDNGSAILDIVVCMDNLPTCSSLNNPDELANAQSFDSFAKEYMEHYSDRINPDSPVNISYTDDGGNELVLYHNQTFNPERNTKYVLKFSLSDAIANGGISANLADEGEMGEKDFQL